MSVTHQPVLLDEVIRGLHIIPGANYIDATSGGGGHTRGILEKGGQVLGIDQDPQAIDYVRQTLPHPHLTLVPGNFNSISDIATQHGFTPCQGILYDLGTSAFQLETPMRGFSFQRDEPLDMRMDPNLAVTAKDLVNALGRKELTLLFTKYAKEPKAKQIADRIVDARKNYPLQTTGDLIRIIESVTGGRHGKLHPATKVFQALRIAVNDELNSLETSLPQAIELLAPMGRLVVISFHEGEDRLVKEFIHQTSTLTSLTKKPIVPQASEVAANPRARSAKLRVATKSFRD
jgi:16S rRNA (cytosine1402-N4)-methyltransferase